MLACWPLLKLSNLQVITTGTDDLTPWREGENLSEGSSVPVVSRWLWPGNWTFLKVASMVVTWWIVAFLLSHDFDENSKTACMRSVPGMIYAFIEHASSGPGDSSVSSHQPIYNHQTECFRDFFWLHDLPPLRRVTYASVPLGFFERRRCIPDGNWQASGDVQEV